MSRIGRQPIEVPSTVSVAISPGRVQVNGPLGELVQQVPIRISIAHEEGQIVVTRPSARGEDRALHGLTRSLVANMVQGVTQGFEKHLELQGVGYRAFVECRLRGLRVRGHRLVPLAYTRERMRRHVLRVG